MSPKVPAQEREQYLQERREKILDAAIEAFGRKGLAGTNVSDIARAAGIAKGTIYLYFDSKEEIFGAILTERSFLPGLAHLTRDGDAILEQTLTAIADRYLEYMRDQFPLFRLLVADAHRFPAHLEQVQSEMIGKGTAILAAFLAAQAEAGHTRPLENPFLTARAFWGMLVVYVLTQEILGGQQFTPIDQKEWTREIVRLFLEGIRP